MIADIIQSNDPASISNDLHFHQELINEKIQSRTYFDSSAIIDMLLGVSSINYGGKSKLDIYNSPYTLVLALAYRNWLGNIYTLPPHVGELVEKLKDERLFPDNLHTLGDEDLKENLIANLELEGLNKIKSYSHISDNKTASEEWLIKLKTSSAELFKILYLCDKMSWKHRYKYLTKDANIIQFFSEKEEYQFRNITSEPLFKDLIKYFNATRKKSSNNYVDALALCILDERVKLYNNSEGKILPVFFSNQEHILTAVKVLSKRYYEDRRPFIYNGKKNDFLIVRNSDFFIIRGVFRTLMRKDSFKLVEEFEKALENYVNLQKKRINESIVKLFTFGSQDKFSNSMKSNLKSRAEEKIILEFFDQWWHEGGVTELMRVFREQPGNKNKDLIKDQVDNFIQLERKRLNSHFNTYSNRVNLIKLAWNQLSELSEIVEKNYLNNSYRLSVRKELGPRFSFSEPICAEVQILVDNMLTAVKNKEKDDVEYTKSEVITDLIIGIFEYFDSNTSTQEKDVMLAQLKRALGFLWIFEMYDLLDTAGTIIRKQTQLQTSNDDEYPLSSIAMIHAAAIIRGSANSKKHALDIIICVENKFSANNYMVWIGLSYLYFLLWNTIVDNYDFPELNEGRYEDSSHHNTAERYMEKAIFYSKKAIEWLEERRKDDSALEKQKYRQRKYYYALNNYLFFLTVYAPKKDFLAGMSLLRKLEQSIRFSDIWQGDRFSDTLARFYYRLVYLFDSQEDIAMIYLKAAMEYNANAIKNSKRAKHYYQSLQRELQAVEITLTSKKPLKKIKNVIITPGDLEETGH